MKSTGIVHLTLSIILLFLFACGKNSLDSSNTSTRQALMWPPLCDCYYNRDCGDTRYYWCAFKKCHTNKVNNKTQDGLCEMFPKVPIDLDKFGMAVGLYIQAYEDQGTDGKISSAKTQRNKAFEIDISKTEHHIAQNFAKYVVGMTVGRTEYCDELPHVKGFFDIGEDDEFGNVLKLDATMLEALSGIRKTIVSNLSDSEQQSTSALSEQFRQDHPAYKGFGRCEFPHPKVHDHPFPFKDDVSCLMEEIQFSIARIKKSKKNS